MNLKIDKRIVLCNIDEVLDQYRDKVAVGELETRHTTMLILNALEDLYENLVDSEEEHYQ